VRGPRLGVVSVRRTTETLRSSPPPATGLRPFRAVRFLRGGQDAAVVAREMQLDDPFAT
jgi:hypothetical protein